MKAKFGLVAAVLGLAALMFAARWWWAPAPATSSVSSTASAPTVTLETATRKVSPGSTGVSTPGVEADESAQPISPDVEPEVLPPQSWQLDPAAVASLRDAMQHGDARTPPLAPAEEREAPSAEELADPTLYAAYELRQQMQVYQSFLQAADKQIVSLEDDIARARAEGGVTDAQLAEGERKLEALKQQRDEVAQRYPELDTSSDSAPSAEP